MNPNPAPNQTETDESYIGWARYIRRDEWPTRLVLCDSNDEGAFKIYRGKAAVPEAPPSPVEAASVPISLARELFSALQAMVNYAHAEHKGLRIADEALNHFTEFTHAAKPPFAYRGDTEMGSRLYSALERLRHNAGRIFDKKPVRDWAETLGEADSAMNAYELQRKPAAPPADTDEIMKTGDAPQRPRLDFWAWWRRDGKFYDPDTEDVPWYDKRQFLAERAFDAGVAQSTNYTANEEVNPWIIAFANGRVVSIAFDDGEPYLEIGLNQQLIIEVAAPPADTKDAVNAMLDD